MTKEEFIKEFCNEKNKIIVSNLDDSSNRVINILNYLKIKYFLGKNQINLREDLHFEKMITTYEFIDNWMTTFELTEEYSTYIINKILSENDINDEIKYIDETNDFNFSHWINLKTTKEYSIYWTVESRNLKIAIRNCGMYNVTFK